MMKALGCKRLPARRCVLPVALAALAPALLTSPALAQVVPSTSIEPENFLAGLAGDYQTVSHRRISPQATPETSRGHARLVPVVDGRFLLEENDGGKGSGAYQGIRLYGFNRATGRFEASWIYSHSPAILAMRAERRDSSGLRFEGSFDAGAGRQAPVRANLRRTGDGFVVELLATAADGSDFVAVETTYSKRERTQIAGAEYQGLRDAVGRWTAEVEYPGASGRRRATASLVITPLEFGDGVAFQYRTVRNGQPFSVLETYELGGGAVLQNHVNSADGDPMRLRGGTGASDNIIRTKGYLKSGGAMRPIETTLSLTGRRSLLIEWHVLGADGSRERLVRVSARRNGKLH